MKTKDKAGRRFPVLFGSPKEKDEAAEFATNVRGCQSLNAYLLQLWRNDKREHEKLIPGASGELAEGRRQ